MKDKKEKEIAVPKFEPLPFFKKDCLVFQNSGHVLRLSNGYYRCDLDCKGECNKKERQFEKEAFEKRFTRFANKFKITSTGAEVVFKKLFKKVLIQMIDQDESDFGCEEVMETTMTAAEQNFNMTGKVKKSDLKDFEEALIQSNTLDYPIVLMSYICGTVRSFSLKQNTVGMGRDLALITKKVFLSDSGEIESIELERWGWYILNYIDKNFPNYFYGLKKEGVKILNGEDESLNLEIEDAVNYFSKNFNEALHNHSITFFYSALSELKKMISTLTDGDPQKVNLAVLGLYKEFSTNPALQLAFKAVPLAVSKVGKKKVIETAKKRMSR